MSIDFAIEPEFQAKLDWARKFITEWVEPLETLHHEVDKAVFMRIVTDLQARVKEQRLWATHLPHDLGGQGYGQVKLGLLNELEGRTLWAPLVFGNEAPDTGNSEILALAGTPEQKDRWLFPLLDGRIRSAFSMTEPDNAGSDPTVMSTRAVLDGDHWVINGHKWFSSNAGISDFLIVMCVTDPDAAPHERASMIIVPNATPGVSVARQVPTMFDPEPYGYGHPEVVYRDVRVPRSYLLGRVGGGFELAQKRLGPGRIHHCMRWIGQAQRALEMLCERANQRLIGGAPLAEKQTIQNWIADSAAEIQAARLMTLHAAWVIDTEGQRAARTEISMIKYFGARVLHDVVDRALQAHGALGYSGDLPLEDMYRRARAARIYDGPDEVHRVTVARRLLRAATVPPPAGPWPSQHIPTRRQAAREQFAGYLTAPVEVAT